MIYSISLSRKNKTANQFFLLCMDAYGMEFCKKEKLKKRKKVVDKSNYLLYTKKVAVEARNLTKQGQQHNEH